ASGLKKGAQAYPSAHGYARKKRISAGRTSAAASRSVSGSAAPRSAGQRVSSLVDRGGGRIPSHRYGVGSLLYRGEAEPVAILHPDFGHCSHRGLSDQKAGA